MPANVKALLQGVALAAVPFSKVNQMPWDSSSHMVAVSRTCNNALLAVVLSHLSCWSKLAACDHFQRLPFGN